MFCNQERTITLIVITTSSQESKKNIALHPHELACLQGVMQRMARHNEEHETFIPRNNHRFFIKVITFGAVWFAEAVLRSGQSKLYGQTVLVNALWRACPAPANWSISRLIAIRLRSLRLQV